MNAYAPRSPCAPRCARHELPAVSAGVTARRWVLLARHLAPASRGDQPRAHARNLLDALAVHHDTDTQRLSVPGDRGTLIVANHISWLDIVGLLAIEPTGFLAKREVARWPVIGTLARGMGTVFLDRLGLRELPTAVTELATILDSGHSVVVFPEATTWCSLPGGAFRRAPFQAALDAGAPVRPVTIDYSQAHIPSTVAAFVGDDTLAGSLRRVVRASALTMRVRAHPALAPEGDRRSLAANAEQAAYYGQRRPEHAGV